jgi:hypothetical protein
MTLDKKVTPVYDVTWFIKWASTFVLIVGSFLNAQNMYPINVYVMMVGVTGWFTVGCLWRDRALIVLNTIIFCFYLFSSLS